MTFSFIERFIFQVTSKEDDINLTKTVLARRTDISMASELDSLGLLQTLQVESSFLKASFISQNLQTVLKLLDSRESNTCMTSMLYYVKVDN